MAGGAKYCISSRRPHGECTEMTIPIKAEIRQYSRELATYTLNQFSLAYSQYERDKAPSSLAHPDKRTGA